jgi:hypothetical protein
LYYYNHPSQYISGVDVSPMDRTSVLPSSTPSCLNYCLTHCLVSMRRFAQFHADWCVALLLQYGLYHEHGHYNCFMVEHQYHEHSTRNYFAHLKKCSR